MTCKNCNRGELTIDDSTGGTNGGNFSEEYSCNVCGARGFVSGESSDPPNEWDKYGSAFQGNPA